MFVFNKTNTFWKLKLHNRWGFIGTNHERSKQWSNSTKRSDQEGQNAIY